MRKLASIQYVHHVEPIEGADKIELVKVLGWQCVAPKGDFKVGDLCVYFEVDSFLPICDKFEFLRKSSYKKNDVVGEGFRLKTIKLRGQISQGLVQPLNILPQNIWNIGDDVTDILDVKKWEEEEKVTDFGTVCGDFPSAYFQKSDEMRCQAVPEIINEFAGKEVYISTKMDGTSVSVYHLGDHFGVCGRNCEYSEGKVVDHIKSLGLNINTLPEGYMVQGEFCGAGIQKNRLKLIKPEWYVFTVQTPEGRLGLEDMIKFCEEHNLKHVPIEEVKSFDFNNVEELLDRAKGKYPSGMHKEGIVIRPIVPCHSEILNDWLSVKAINNDYLLKELKMIYFTSDLHFDHDNIIKYCNRPYKNITEMNNMLIVNWNSVVKPQDTVYILGDIMMSKNAGDVSKYIERLTGHKILIQGNHDYFVKDYKNQRYDFLDDIKPYEEINYNKLHFCLMHYPIMDWNHMYHGSYMLHGHMHNEPIYNYNNKNEGLKRYDVGVDANNYIPISIEQIINFFK